MAVVRLEALRALECAITQAVPELAGRICPWPGLPNHNLMFPSLAIVPVRWRYMPDQAWAGFSPSPSSVVMNVGKHEALIQLRLVDATPAGRAPIEERS